MFLIPVVGLFLGFGVGLLVGEFSRRKNLTRGAACLGIRAEGDGSGNAGGIRVRGPGLFGVDDRRHRALQHALTRIVRPGTNARVLRHTPL